MTKLVKKSKPKESGNIKKVTNKVSRKAKDKVKKVKKSIAKSTTIKKGLNTISPKKIVKKIKKNGITIRDSQIEQAVKSVLKLIKLKENNKNGNQLFDDEQAIFAQVVAVKVPKAIPRTLRILLPHVPQSCDEVCFIVPSLEKAKKDQVDNTIEHYEKLLSGIGIKKFNIIPLYQLLREYETFEMKRHLAEMYDLFLVASNISGKVLHFLGKIFIQKRKQPIPIHMDRTNLKGEFDRCMKKTSMAIHSRGDSFISQIGYDRMESNLIVENISAFVKNIQNQFPGGAKNVRIINIKGHQTKAVPLYYNLVNKNDVPYVVEAPKRSKKHVVLTDELSTYMNSQVTVFPDGTVIKRKIPLNEDIEDLDEEITTDNEDSQGNDFDDSDAERKPSVSLKKNKKVKNKKQIKEQTKKDEQVKKKVDQTEKKMEAEADDKLDKKEEKGKLKTEKSNVMNKKKKTVSTVNNNKQMELIPNEIGISKEAVKEVEVKNTKKVNNKKRKNPPRQTAKATAEVLQVKDSEKENVADGERKTKSPKKRNATSDGKDKIVEQKKAKTSMQETKHQNAVNVGQKKQNKKKAKPKKGPNKKL